MMNRIEPDPIELLELLELEQKKHLERRQAHRKPQIDLSRGELTLMYDGRPIELFQVKDVSPLGICVQAAEPARRYTRIEIRYHDPAWQIEVRGVWIWQERVETVTDSRYWIGICFDRDRHEHNLALFELLRTR